MLLLACTCNVMWWIMGEKTGTANIRTALRSGMWFKNGNHVGQSTKLLARKTLYISLAVAQNGLSMTEQNASLKCDHQSLVLFPMVPA